MRVEQRIGLSESVVGRLQPILAELPRRTTATVLRGRRATSSAWTRWCSERTQCRRGWR